MVLVFVSSTKILINPTYKYMSDMYHSYIGVTMVVILFINLLTLVFYLYN